MSLEQRRDLFIELLNDSEEEVRIAAAAALERGVWVRPFRDLVYTMPPYVTSNEDLSTLTAALVGSVADVHG